MTEPPPPPAENKPQASTAAPPAKAAPTPRPQTPPPAPKPKPVETLPAPVEPTPAPAPPPPPRQDAQKQFSCEELPFSLRLTCAIEGKDVIRKCAPDLKAWNHNIPGCNRQNSTANQ